MTIAHFRPHQLAHDLHPPRRPPTYVRTVRPRFVGAQTMFYRRHVRTRAVGARLLPGAGALDFMFPRAPPEQIWLSLAPQTCFECRLRRIVDVSIKATSSLNQSSIHHCTLNRATATQNHHIEQQSPLTSKPASQTRLARHVVHRQVVHSGHPLV